MEAWTTFAARRFCSVRCAARGRRKADPLARLWEGIEQRGPDECWPWLRGRTEKGYGRIDWQGRDRRAHDVVWEVVNGGPLPEGHIGMHTCDHTWCCNPAHIVPGLPAANSADMVAKGRSPRGTARPNAKLNPDKVRAIRRAYQAGVSMSTLARHYGVHSSTISDVLSGDNWWWVDD